MSQRIKHVGRLRLPFPLTILGRGAFGNVIKGELNGRPVAAKKMESANFNRYLTAELQRLKVIALLRHENIVQYFGEETEPQYCYVILELCAGTLEELVKNTKPSLPSLEPKEEILRQMTVGVQYLHFRKIVHRDLNPKNVLISEHGTVKLADFGLSKEKKQEASSFSKTGHRGTDGWAAPEFYNEVDTRFRFQVDIFSLGCLFAYVLTSGGHPFGIDPSSSGRVENIKKGQLDWKEENKIDDEELRRLIKLMVSFDPLKRPSLNLILLKLIERLLFSQTTGVTAGTFFHSLCPSMQEYWGSLRNALKWSKYSDGQGNEALLLLVCKTLNNSRKVYVQSLFSQLLNIDLDVHATDAQNRNALLAILEHSPEDGLDLLALSEFLISKGVSAKLKNNNGDCAIGLAIANFGLEKKPGLLNLVKLLLDHGADPKTVNNDGWSLINLACRYYHMDDLIDVLRLLVSKGAQLDRRADCGNNALTLVARYYPCNNLAEVLSFLIDGAHLDVNSTDNDNWNALLNLCGETNKCSAEALIGAVKLLLSRGISIEAKTSQFGMSALHLASKYFGFTAGAERNQGLAEVTKAFLEKGADPNIADIYRHTPLYYVCEHYKKEDFVQVISLLIKDYGAHVTVGANTVEPDLLVTAMSTQYHQENIVDIIRVFIEGGANVNGTCTNGKTALIYLCQRYTPATGLIAAARLFVEKGINVNAKDRSGWTALHYSTKHFGNDRNERLSELVAILVDGGAEVNVNDKNGWTPLLLACKHYQREDLLDVIQLLKSKGANTDHCCDDGNARELILKYNGQHAFISDIISLLQ